MQQNTYDGNFHGNKNNFFHPTHKKWSMFELIFDLVLWLKYRRRILQLGEVFVPLDLKYALATCIIQVLAYIIVGFNLSIVSL